MKRFLIILICVIAVLCALLLISALLISRLFAPRDAILNSLPDYIDKEFYSCNGFQDTTDYAKYTYKIYETELIDNPYFLCATEENIPQILSYIDNFEGWVDTCSDFPAAEYDFDKSLIAPGDYFYILNRYDTPGSEFDNYNLYYFDLDAQILYYFHNNI